MYEAIIMKNMGEKDFEILEEEFVIFGEKVKIRRLVRKNNKTLASCNKNIEPAMKENHKALRLSMQELNEKVYWNTIL